jgi:alpha,alpha-trehalase
VTVQSNIERIPKPDFVPLDPIDGYLRIKDHGLVGDCATAALIARDGAVSWLCLPHFESPALFCSLLDRQHGGTFRITPVDLVEARQFYVPDTGILVTELKARSGVVRITDAMTFRDGADLMKNEPVGRGELLRSVEALHGKVRLRIEVDPRGETTVRRRGESWEFQCELQPELKLKLIVDRPLEGPRSELELEMGQRLHLSLRWGDGEQRSTAPEELLENTIQVWRSWAKHFTYQGPREPVVRRSAITLKLLDFIENGAIVAAPTSSLPEEIGGERNWDYRYTWIRDAAFSVYALRRIGLRHEALSFLAWVLDSTAKGDRPQVLYNLNGGKPPPEWEDAELKGYRGSHPVRWGNAAADQKQHDVYGEILDCAFQWMRGGGNLNSGQWEQMRHYIEAAAREWNTPDHGIWEVRTAGNTFTYSAAMCQVALDRGARIAEQLNLPCDLARWRAEAARIKDAILEKAWDPKRQALTEHLERGGLDASLLSLPLRRVLPVDHPRMVATTAAVSKHLGAGKGLLYRYLPDESPDGLSGKEGAFLLCSFWLVENLAWQGRLDEATELFDSLCDRGGTLGLMPEQIDPATDAFLGNYPQAFSHVGLISAGARLARLTGGNHS